MTGLFERAKEIYCERGARELLFRGVNQISYQFFERFYGSRLWFRIRAYVNGIRYEMVSDPYEITFVDPADIRYRSARAQQSDHSRWKDIGRIQDGKWDIESKTPKYKIENELLYRAIKDHFKREIPWEETEYVKKSLERLQQDNYKETWRAVVRTEDDLWERCNQLDELYERITKQGYKSKNDVFDSESNDPMGYYPRTFKYTIDEVMVDRGRDGEPLLVDGQHRLFIARVCDIESIPVVIAVRHKKWIEDFDG